MEPLARAVRKSSGLKIDAWELVPRGALAAAVFPNPSRAAGEIGVSHGSVTRCPVLFQPVREARPPLPQNRFPVP
jgi:hypothetical protein